MSTWTLRVVGLAPHVDTTITLPHGGATIRGPSGVGKSTLLVQAALLALTGAGSEREPSTAATVATPTPPGRIAAGSVATVELTTPAGGRLTWSCASGGRPERSLRRASGEVITDPAAIGQALGAAGDRDVVAAIMAPMWMLGRLALPPAASQPMRDVLSRALVAGRVSAYLDEHLQPHEPRDRKRADKAATDTRRDALHAAGALSAIVGDPDPEPIRPDPDRVAAARAKHAAHVEATEAHHRTIGALGALPDIAAAERAAKAWDVRRAGIVRPKVPRPEGEIGALLQARDLADRAAAAHAAVAADRRTAALLEQVPCKGQRVGIRRDLFDDESESIEVDCGTCPLLRTAREARDRTPAALPDLPDVDAARAAVEAAQAWLAHDAELARLGERPVVPAPVERPVAPVLAPWVGEVLQAATRAEAAHEAWTARQASRAARLETAQATAASTAAAAERATEVQRLVREAPGLVLSEVAAQLGELAGLTVDASPSAVSVAWRGIPWGSLSSGQSVAADAAFRVALRSMCGLDWLPVVIDDAQLATGEDVRLPGDDAGPVWVIRGAAPGESGAIRVEVSDGE